jgi:hypothetical protein
LNKNIRKITLFVLISRNIPLVDFIEKRKNLDFPPPSSFFPTYCPKDEEILLL